MIMATADESNLFNPLYTTAIRVRLLGPDANPCTHVSRDVNPVTPGRPYVVVLIFKVFSNNGMRQVSSTSR